MQTEAYPYQSKLLAEREARGRAIGAEELLLTVMEARGLDVAEAQRRKTERCEDMARRKVRAKRALTAPSVDDMRCRRPR